MARYLYLQTMPLVLLSWPAESLGWVLGDLGTEIFADSIGNFIGAISPEEGVETFRDEAERRAKK